MDKPMLFKSEMVRAILDSRKTMTRRIVKLTDFGLSDTPGYKYHFRDKRLLWNDVNDNLFDKFCPWKKGDHLWVKETHYIEPCNCCVKYKASADINTFCSITKWKPSIFMEKRFARIWLEVTGVRVERLHDITVEDCIKEGVEKTQLGEYRNYHDPKKAAFTIYREGIPVLPDAEGSYWSLWDSINGYDSWDLNPWVWVIEFNRIEKPEGY